MKEKINVLLKEAMKAKDTNATQTYRSIVAAFTNAEKTDGVAPNEAAQIAILKKMATQREETAKIYTTNNRLDLATIENSEAIIIRNLLPQELDDVQARAFVKTYIAENNIEVVKSNMGTAVKAIVAAGQGKLNGKQVSTIFNQLLNQVA